MSANEHAIDTLMVEGRRYPPPPGFAADANAGPDVYERDPDEFWRGRGEAHLVVQPVRAAARVGAALRQVVRWAAA